MQGGWPAPVEIRRQKENYAILLNSSKIHGGIKAVIEKQQFGTIEIPK